jgi:hypothetical protein
MLADSLKLWTASKFFRSANVFCAVNVCVAEILCFIHDKDGKKEYLNRTFLTARGDMGLFAYEK